LCSQCQVFFFWLLIFEWEGKASVRITHRQGVFYLILLIRHLGNDWIFSALQLERGLMSWVPTQFWELSLHSRLWLCCAELPSRDGTLWFYDTLLTTYWGWDMPHFLFFSFIYMCI
jgi:hypothetical protein